MGDPHPHIKYDPLSATLPWPSTPPTISPPLLPHHLGHSHLSHPSLSCPALPCCSLPPLPLPHPGTPGESCSTTAAEHSAPCQAIFRHTGYPHSYGKYCAQR